MNPENKKCANCIHWKEEGPYHENDNEDFAVIVGPCKLRNDSYTDEFYSCDQFEPKEEVWQ